MHLSETSYFQGIPMAPLWDFCKGQFVGVLSALDFILIIKEVCVEDIYSAMLMLCVPDIIHLLVSRLICSRSFKFVSF